MLYSPFRKPGAWRRSTQALFTLFFLVAPWVQVGEGRFLGLDAEAGRLYAFGTGLRVTDLYLLLLFTLALLFFFLWIAAAVGRLWCGWGCPQTIVSDLAEWALRGLDPKRKKGGGALFHLLMAALAAGFAATFTLYFVPPARFFTVGYFAQLGPGVMLFGVTALILYADMVWARRSFCRVACPYGKILTVLSDQDALTVETDSARMVECIQCGACKRICPMELDVREGAGGDCIRCGRCLEACSRSLGRARQAGKTQATGSLIRFAFGAGTRARHAFFGVRRLPLLLAFVAALTAWVWFATREAVVTFQVRVAAAASVRTTAQGDKAVFFDAVIGSPASTTEQYSLHVRGPQGENFSPAGIGETIEVEPQQRTKVRFALTIPVARARTTLPLTFRLVDQRGDEAAQAELMLPPLE